MNNNEPDPDKQETPSSADAAKTDAHEAGDKQTAETKQPTAIAKQDRCCIVCNRFLPEGGSQICVTCETDNTSWFALRSYERRALFPSWAWLGTLAAVGLQQWAYLFLRGGWKPGASWAGALLESLPFSLLTLVSAAAIYVAREPLRRYELKRKLKLGGLRPSLNLLALSMALLGVAGALTATLLVIIISEFPALESSTTFLRGITPIIPSFALPFTTTAIMFLGANTYVRQLQKRFPSPIYCDANQMCEVVLKALATTYLAPHRVKVEKSDPDDDEVPALRAPTHLEVESTGRNQTGGLDLVVREYLTVWEADQKNSKFTGKSDAVIYDVSTDEWAQIVHFEPRRQKIRLAIYEPDVKTGR